VIEDFYRLASEMVLYYPSESISSTLMESVLIAACRLLVILKEEPILAVLHFLRDLLGYGRDMAPSSSFDTSRQEVPLVLQNRIKQLINGAGLELVQRIMTGMMYSFPGSCFPDGSGVLLELFELMPQQVAVWVQQTVSMLPSGSITPQESERFLNNIRQYVPSLLNTSTIISQAYYYNSRRHVY
jgi:transportin-3